MLVVDATVALSASGVEAGFDELGDDALFAPPLMWSEARSVLHELAWRGVVSPADADRTRARLEDCPVARRSPRRLGEEAWRLADELGWAKTYDAEYVTLARLLGCRLVTLDARLRRGTARLGLVVGPHEL
ncbi:MAG: type II toxin-antitoxin system VapC family toxin [Acidimicrobiales bacterium]